MRREYIFFFCLRRLALITDKTTISNLHIISLIQLV